MKYFTFLLVFLFGPMAASSPPPEEIVTFSSQLLRHRGQNYVAVTFRNLPQWHTYWKNPGDTGLPFEFRFESDGKDVELSPLEWPNPRRYLQQKEGSIGGEGTLAFGYSGEYSFFFSLPPPMARKAKAGQTDLTVFSRWLMCRDVCIPGQGSLAIGQGPFEVSPQDLKKRLEAIPRERPFPPQLKLLLGKSKGEGELALYYEIAALGPGPSARARARDGNLLTPFPLDPFEFKRETLRNSLEAGEKKLHGQYTIEWNGQYSTPPLPFPSHGQFSRPYTFKFLLDNPFTQRVEVIKKTFSSFQKRDVQREAFFSSQPQTQLRSQPRSQHLLSLILLAFIGGAFLNIMPCVLPVITLKLFGLIKYRGASKGAIFKHNVFYSLGILVTFFVLALTVFFLKASGESMGWGFQLQSPHFVSAIMAILFILTLNLFGLFEFPTLGGKIAGQIQGKNRSWSHFFSGMLSTFLATPCSAPFLGTALAFAFTADFPTLLGMFLSMGMGLASPFLVTACYPRLVSLLPSPGPWMEHFKKFLGLTLIFTVIWLFHIFIAQTDTAMAMRFLMILALLFFAIYGHHSSLFKRPLWKVLALALPLLLFVHMLLGPLSKMPSSGSSSSVEWRPWSVESLERYRREGQLVFMDFTAKWCLTCQVNEKLVLQTQGFRQLAKTYKMKLLLADWTKPNLAIGNWLAQQGTVGIPAYFIQTPRGDIINLGETISLEEIREEIRTHLKLLSD